MKYLTTFSLLVFIFGNQLFAQSQGQEEIEKAQSAFSSGDYATWYEESEKAAEKGNVTGYFYLANALDPVYAKSYPYPEEKSSEKAFEYYKKASDLGHGVSTYTVAEMYRLGDGVATNGDEALNYYKKSYMQGNNKGLNAVAQLSEDKSLFVKWLEKCVSEKNFNAARELGSLYISGTFVEKDIAKSMEWLKKGEANNHAGCIYVIGYLYRNGFDEAEDGKVQLFNEKADIPKAVEYYEKAAKLGSIEACNNLAEMNMQGMEVDQNMDSSFDWFKKSCELNDGYGCYMCSVLLSQNYVERSDEDAGLYAKRSLELGYYPSGK